MRNFSSGKISMKTVMVFGTFDIIHLGHLHLFQQAKKYGNKLIVVVARDTNVKKAKKHSPLHTEQERINFLRHINLVNNVCLGYKTDYYRIIKEKKPTVIALGYDQKIDEKTLKEKIKKFGLHTKIVRLLPYGKRVKSSLIKKYIEKNI